MSIFYTHGKRPARPLWSTETGGDAASSLNRSMNLDQLAMARHCCPDPDADVERHLATLTARFGLTRRRVSAYCDIGLMLCRFPTLAEHLSHGMFGFDHLVMLTRCLDGIGDGTGTGGDDTADMADGNEVGTGTGDGDHGNTGTDGEDDRTRSLEQSLIALLTPRRHGESLPGIRSLHNRIQTLIAEFDALARPLDLGEQPTTRTAAERAADRETVRPRVDVMSVPGSPATTVTATLGTAEAEEFLTVLDAVRRKYTCSRAAALMHLVRGTADVSVTLNLYRDPASPVATTANGTWLTAMATEEFMARVSTLRILGHASTEAYTPTEAIAAFVRGRDGTCRFPGCEVPASDCDLDHVMRFGTGDPATGGPTSTTNLHCLCRRHHLMKTMGWFDVTVTAEGTEMWTSIADGHLFMTEPTGPLARFARSTFRTRSTRRTATLREHNRIRIEEQEVLRAALADARTDCRTDSCSGGHDDLSPGPDKDPSGHPSPDRFPSPPPPGEEPPF